MQEARRRVAAEQAREQDLPPGRREQVVTAVVVPKEGETIELPEVRQFLQEKGVAGYKEPRRLVVVEALPRNPLGKVLKREIRDRVKA